MFLSDQSKQNISQIVIMTLFCVVRKRVIGYTAYDCPH